MNSSAAASTVASPLASKPGVPTGSVPISLIKTPLRASWPLASGAARMAKKRRGIVKRDMSEGRRVCQWGKGAPCGGALRSALSPGCGRGACVRRSQRPRAQAARGHRQPGRAAAAGAGVAGLGRAGRPPQRRAHRARRPRREPSERRPTMPTGARARRVRYGSTCGVEGRGCRVVPRGDYQGRAPCPGAQLALCI